MTIPVIASSGVAGSHSALASDNPGAGSLVVSIDAGTIINTPAKRLHG